MNKKQMLGKWGEQQAVKYLEQHGYRLLHLNKRTSYGEVDMVVTDGEMAVFVEVKTRSSPSFGDPEISVDMRKRRHVMEAASAIIQNNPDLGESWRIDVLSVEGSPEIGVTHIEWFQNAFS
jgi:putative endonuclease